jgi:hypothetical protein
MVNVTERQGRPVLRTICEELCTGLSTVAVDTKISFPFLEITGIQGIVSHLIDCFPRFFATRFDCDLLTLVKVHVFVVSGSRLRESSLAVTHRLIGVQAKLVGTKTACERRR